MEAEGIVEADTGHYSAPEEVRTAKHDVRVDHGDLDETVPLADTLAWATPRDVAVAVVPGGEHFFHRKLHVLREIVARNFGIALEDAEFEGRGARRRDGDIGTTGPRRDAQLVSHEASRETASRIVVRSASRIRRSPLRWLAGVANSRHRDRARWRA